MTSTSPKTRRRSAGSTTVHLPVARSHDEKAIRPSRNRPRRFLVLIVVQLLLIGHVAIWLLSKQFGWFGGATITPIEPSESMEFAKTGVINAGLIFFLLALLSTLIFGRWFCGWGCHVLLLQDGSAWLLEKMGIRPKPFRSRLLIYVPLALALYMFIWPPFYRLAVAPWLNQTQVLPPWRAEWHLTTTDFWQTFPGWMVAVPFLLICGFGCVYFLGTKGFCTYGCPYGGFFAPLDEFSPARIRVTDDCEQCGHCTAVCSSNVRVHDEVREYGMVVDPGCFKCLDCVSVCPKDALYFGFGKPAVQKGVPKNAAPKRKYDLAWREEFALLIVFVGLFLCFRGGVVRLPLLMTAGVAAVLTWLVWLIWRMIRREHVTLHKMRLKFRGKWRPAGVVAVVVAVLVVVMTLHSGVVNAALAFATWHDKKLELLPDELFGSRPVLLDATEAEHARDAIWWYERASTIREGGLAITPFVQPNVDSHIAKLHVALRNYDAAEERIRGAIERDGISETAAANLALIQRSAGDHAAALETYRKALLALPTADHVLQSFSSWAGEHGFLADAIAIYESRAARYKDDVRTLQVLSLLYLEVGRTNDGIAMIRRTNDLLGQNPSGYRILALALAGEGRLSEAIDAMETAVEQAPDNVQFAAELAELRRAYQ